jgi:hypothetical protein
VARIKYKEVFGIKVKRGRPSLGNRPGKKELQQLYVEESRSIREVANILGCSKDMVNQCLKENGIERRVGIKRSNLRAYNLDFLKKNIQKKGFRATAEALGINERTLRDYIKVN